MLLPSGCDVTAALRQLRELEQEDPLLHVVWDERLGEVQLQLMGEVQLEVLQSLIERRFGLRVGFDEGGILYKETINTRVEGMGHFEPLRHYAEVHLILEPGEPGSGVQLAASCPTDSLAANWQRLVLTHLAERTHVGPLTGSPLTDVKITLAAGRAHIKHTEGGDFRQATYRAVRQGLRTAQARGGCVLLEPWYDFTLIVPQEALGRALAAAALEDLPACRVLLVNSAPGSAGGSARLEGARATLEAGGAEVEEAQLDPADDGTELETVLAKSEADAVLLFEPSATETAASAKEKLSLAPALYGVGSTSPIAAALEQGTLSASAVWSDFAAGYLAVEGAVHAARGESWQPQTLDFSILRGEDMYEPDNQKLLFPVAS